MGRRLTKRAVNWADTKFEADWRVRGPQGARGPGWGSAARGARGAGALRGLQVPHRPTRASLRRRSGAG